MGSVSDKEIINGVQGKTIAQKKKHGSKIIKTWVKNWVATDAPSLQCLRSKTHIPSVIPLVKMTRYLFFLLCFKFFCHGNSVGIYRGNISVGKIPRKFTDENIPSVFPFVFINFLVVCATVSSTFHCILSHNPCTVENPHTC